MYNRGVSGDKKVIRGGMEGRRGGEEPIHIPLHSPDLFGAFRLRDPG